MISLETRAIAIALHHLMTNIQSNQPKKPLFSKNRSNHNKNKKGKKEKNQKLTLSIPEEWKGLKAILKLSKADLNKKNWKRKSLNWTLLIIHSLLANPMIQTKKNKTKANRSMRPKLNKSSQNPFNRKKIMKIKSFLRNKKRRKTNKTSKQLWKSSALLLQLVITPRRRKRRKRKTKKPLNRKNPLRRSQLKNKKLKNTKSISTHLFYIR